MVLKSIFTLVTIVGAATVADKKVPVSVLFNAVLFLFRWCSVSVLNFPFTFSVGVAFSFPYS